MTSGSGRSSVSNRPSRIASPVSSARVTSAPAAADHPQGCPHHWTFPPNSIALRDIARVRLETLTKRPMSSTDCSISDHLFAVCRLLGFHFCAAHSRPEGKATLSIAGHARAARACCDDGGHRQYSRRQRPPVRIAASRSVNQNRNGHCLCDPA